MLIEFWWKLFNLFHSFLARPRVIWFLISLNLTRGFFWRQFDTFPCRTSSTRKRLNFNWVNDFYFWEFSIIRLKFCQIFNRKENPIIVKGIQKSTWWKTTKNKSQEKWNFFFLLFITLMWFLFIFRRGNYEINHEEWMEIGFCLSCWNHRRLTLAIFFVQKFNLNNARKFGTKTGKFEMIYLLFGPNLISKMKTWNGRC